jgi:hypothetical protein
MIARGPLKRDPHAGRKPERAVLRNLGARCGRVPASAILPSALDGASSALGSWDPGNPGLSLV